jgi:hypothetical protein
VGTVEYPVSRGSVSFTGTRALVAAGGELFQADADGTLSRVQFSTANGLPLATARVAISGPAVDGADWSTVVGMHSDGHTK